MQCSIPLTHTLRLLITTTPISYSLHSHPFLIRCSFSYVHKFTTKHNLLLILILGTKLQKPKRNAGRIAKQSGNNKNNKKVRRICECATYTTQAITVITSTSPPPPPKATTTHLTLPDAPSTIIIIIWARIMMKHIRVYIRNHIHLPFLNHNFTLSSSNNNDKTSSSLKEMKIICTETLLPYLYYMCVVICCVLFVSFYRHIRSTFAFLLPCTVDCRDSFSVLQHISHHCYIHKQLSWYWHSYFIEYMYFSSIRFNSTQRISYV